MKRVYLLVVFFLICCGLKAQIIEVCSTMPDSLCPYLTQQQRYYMCENAKVGLKDSTINQMNRKSVVDSINIAEKYIRVAISPIFTQEIRIQSDTIVLTNTLCAPECGSLIRYYNFSWQLLRTVIPAFQPTLTEEQKKFFL